MSFTYTIYAFDTTTGTMTVGFEGYDIWNYFTPRANGVYLTGDLLESYIQNLHPTTVRTKEIVLSQTFSDDPSTISGGEDIQAKYQAYLDSVV